MLRRLAPLFLLAGCTSAAQKAEERLAMIERNRGSKQEICDASRQVANAYLDARDEEKYRSAKLHADINCLSAQLSP